MSTDIHNPMDCTQFEALLAEAVDGALGAPEMERFRAHAADCRLCGPSFAEAVAGYQFLEQLDEIEAPQNLVHNILSQTSERDAAEKAVARKASPTWPDKVRETLRPVLTPLMQPRLASTFAMGFFSVSVLLNMAGVHVGDMKAADLKPSAIRATLTRTYYSSRAQVLRYYDNMRFVYELQSRLRDLRNAMPEQEQPRQDKNKKEKDQKNMSDHPGQDNQQNYVQTAPAEYEMAAYRPQSSWVRGRCEKSSALHFSPESMNRQLVTVSCALQRKTGRSVA